MQPCGHHVLHVWGVSLPFPPLSTTQTQRTRPQCHVLRVWVVSHTLDMEMRPQCRVFVSGVVGHPSTTHHHPRHKKRDPVVAFFVSGVFLCPSLHSLLPRRQECDHVVVFFAPGVFPCHSLDPDMKKHDHWVVSFVSGVFSCPIPFFYYILGILYIKIQIMSFLKKINSTLRFQLEPLGTNQISSGNLELILL